MTIICKLRQNLQLLTKSHSKAQTARAIKSCLEIQSNKRENSSKKPRDLRLESWKGNRTNSTWMTNNSIPTTQCWKAPQTPLQCWTITTAPQYITLNITTLGRKCNNLPLCSNYSKPPKAVQRQTNSIWWIKMPWRSSLLKHFCMEVAL